MAQQRKKRAGRKGKKITLSEFKAWLEGIEELQPDDWSPTQEQWKKIRNKIDCIVESEPVAVAPAQQAGQRHPSDVLYSPAEQHQTPQQPPQQGEETVPTLPPVPSSIPDAAGNTGVPAGPSKLADPSLGASGSKPAISGIPEGPDGRIKTPDIDTSDGSYGSGFE